MSAASYRSRRLRQRRPVRGRQCAILARPEVMECFFTTGDADILLRVATPSVSAYDKFLEEFVFSAPGISQVRSNFALRQIKFETALPI